MKLDLDAIEKRAIQATAGPWETDASREGTFIHNGRGFGIIHSSDEDDNFLDLSFAAHARTDVPLLVARVRELEAALDRATQALHRDATGLAKALVDIGKSAAGRMWVTEGRGPYQWDDDRYKEEAGVALCEVIEIAVKGLRESGKIADVEVPAALRVLELGDRELDNPLPLAQNTIEARKKP